MAFDEQLLRTKIIIPEVIKGQIQRVDLLDQLEAAIPAHRLTLVSAQAGYGKTTLLATWAKRHESHSAWLSLSQEDSDLDRFLRYLLFAWRRVNPEVIDSQLGLLLSSQESSMKDALIAFLNQTSQLEHDLFIFLDDYHLIKAEEIHQALGFLIENLPAQVHFILSTRTQPPLPLAGYRAHSHLYQVGPEHLRLDQQEAAAFLQQRMGLDLSEHQIKALQERLEGWVGGLQLAALGASSGAEASLLPTGNQRYLAEYLSQDVLGQQPSDIQEFMLQTSILERFSAELCNAVTDLADCQQRIKELERQNLFLQSLDNRAEWYRYHNLFGDFLQAKLADRSESEVAELHRRAARWFQERNMAEPALRHAVLSQDAQLVEDIGTRFIPLKISRGELKLVERWLNDLPKSWFEEHPMLIISRAAWSAMRGDFQATMADLKLAEACIERSEVQAKEQARARLSAFYCSAACMQNDLEAARVYGKQAAEELPVDDVFFHGMINGSMGDAFRGNGQWEQARRHYLQALGYSRGTDFQFLGIHAYGGLADMSLRQGNLAEAANYWKEALAISEQEKNWGALPLPVIGWAYIRLAEIEYEWNQLGQAEKNLRAGLKRAELGGDLRALAAAEILRGRLALANGNKKEAEAAVEAAGQHLKQGQLPDWTARHNRLMLDFWLAKADMPQANHWLEKHSGETGSGSIHEIELLGIVRVLLANSNHEDTERAFKILSEVLAKAQTEGRSGLQIEALALQAIAHWQGRDQASAMRFLEEALRLAQAERYCRRLIDLGAPMARLLQEAVSRNVIPPKVNELLAIFEQEMALDDSQPPLTEPLTDRELEVLKLMAAGLTNKEIGEQLVISPGTVKKHAANIYGKLEVGGRTEAAARARELSLLD